jgi:adenosylmethionine-8-amino-7-oxononanoate aminotransferase
MNNTPQSHVFFPRDNRLVADYGDGVYIYDVNGKQYLDAIGGTHVNTIGHGVAEIGEVMASQATKLSFVHKEQFTTQAQETLAQRVAEMSPEGMNRVSFVTGGSIANEIALQIARYYHLVRGNTGKYKVIGRWHSYHGRTIGALSMSGSLFVRRGDMAPYDLNFPHIQAPHCYQCPFNLTHPSCELACATELARTLEQEGADTIAAFIAEPIVGGAGSAIVPPVGYYEKIREICDAYDILFISEEVITGFGRTGKNFGIQHWNASPDIIIATKALSSGYAPIGAVIAHDRVWNTFEDAKQKNVPVWVTYSGNPISCAVALAVQDYVVKHHLIEQCVQRGNYLQQALLKLAEREPLIGNVRGKGLMIGLEFVKDRDTHQPYPRAMKLTEQIVQTALREGLMTRGRFGTGVKKDGDHIMLSPPLIISEAECDEIVTKLEIVLQKVKQSL